MYMNDEEAEIRQVKGGLPFVLRREDVLEIIGVYSSDTFLTDWNADTVIKVFSPQYEFEGEEVYAKFTDYRIVWDTSSEGTSKL